MRLFLRQLSVGIILIYNIEKYIYINYDSTTVTRLNAYRNPSPRRN